VTLANARPTQRLLRESSSQLCQRQKLGASRGKFILIVATPSSKSSRTLTDAIYGRAAEAIGQETVDVRILNDRSIVSVQAAVPPIYERPESSE
jgi:hypothetical protein